MNEARPHRFFGIVEVDSRHSKTISDFTFGESIQIDGRGGGYSQPNCTKSKRQQ